MEEQVFSMFLEKGGFAILFVWLLTYTMKNNKERESLYQKTISKNQEVIEEQAKAFTSLSSDVHEIKDILKDRGAE